MVMTSSLEKPKSVVELAARLSSLGYWPVPIPSGCKGPSIPGWQNLKLTADEVPEYFREGDGMLVGILHNNVLALDIDVYDAELSKKISDEALRRFPGALLRIGQPPKSALFLRMEEPGFKVHNTEKHETVTEDGEIISAQVEVRSVSRQIVVYGKHPSTGKPYTWPNGELWATPRGDLPEASQGDIERFRDWCDDAIRKWAGLSDKKIIDLGTYASSGFADEKASEDQFRAALSHVSSNAGHDEWVHSLMAIHDFYEGSQAGLQVAHEWSSSYPNYSAREVETKWKSFELGKGVTYRTIFHKAKMAGADMSAISRIGKPEPEIKPNFDYDPAPTESDPNPRSKTWRIQNASEFTADFVAPEYIIDGVIQRGRLYTLTAPTGSGKTAVMLFLSSAIAAGQEVMGREVEGGDVLFLAGENPDDVRARVIAQMEASGVRPERLHFIPGTFSIRADMERLTREAAKLPNLVLIVVDTFAAYFDGDDENSNAQALDFARVIRGLTAIESRPAVVMPAHPVKNASRGNLSPKGGSSLVNEVDGNLTLWKEGGVTTMHWQVKIRGPEFDPLQFELVPHESDAIRDSKGRRMPTILAKPLLLSRAMELSQENMTLEDRVLLTVDNDPALSLDGRGVLCGGVHKQKIKRTLQKLESQRLVRMFRTNWELTKDGEKAVEMIRDGQQFAPEIE